MTFFATIVALRIHFRSDTNQMNTATQAHIFHYDVFLHQALATVSDDYEDLEIARRLVAYGFYSPIYSNAGLQMIEDKVAQRFAPAQTLQGDILLRIAQNEAEAEHAISFYHLAAAQNYRPAIEKLAILEPSAIQNKAQ